MLGASWIGQHLSKTASSETRNRNRHSTGNDSVHLEGFSIKAPASDYWHVLCCCCSAAKHVWLFVTPWTAACQASLSFTIYWSLLKLMSVELVTLSNHLILCCPLLLLPVVFPSIRVFSNESALHIKWPSIGASASALVPPMNIQGWFPLGLTGLIFLQSKGLSIVFSSTTGGKH